MIKYDFQKESRRNKMLFVLPWKIDQMPDEVQWYWTLYVARVSSKPNFQY